MGALYFLLRFLAGLQARAEDCRDLSLALLCACVAVMANFALLNVYLGVFAIGLAALVTFNLVNGAPPSPGPSAPGAVKGRRRSFPWLPAVAVVFTLLVFSQDLGLSETLYEPVEVGLAGLGGAELDEVRVSRLDVRGRARGMRREAGADRWYLDRRTQVAGLRIELPAAAAAKLTRIGVMIGGRPFWHDLRVGGAWTSHDAGGTRVLDSGPSLSLPRARMPAFRPMINWAGDARYAARLAEHTAVALLLLCALAVVLKALGWLAVRANLLRSDEWHPLASSALWLATLAGSPLYLLKRGSELFFGGSRGLIDDTFYSTIDGFFYGRAYYPSQVQLVFAGMVVTVAAFGVVCYLGYRRKMLASLLPGACVLAIMAVVSAAVVAQRVIFHTPYLMGRTALFYGPLYVLFATFLCDSIAGLGRWSRVFAIAVLAVALSFSTYHFVSTVNVEYALDWRQDAGTKMMMADLGRIVADERPPGTRVVLGVDPLCSAVAAFYASRQTAATIAIVVVPTPSDFVYVEDRHQRRTADVLKRYPIVGTVLARGGTPR